MSSTKKYENPYHPPPTPIRLSEPVEVVRDMERRDKLRDNSGTGKHVRRDIKAAACTIQAKGKKEAFPQRFYQRWMCPSNQPFLSHPTDHVFRIFFFYFIVVNVVSVLY